MEVKASKVLNYNLGVKLIRGAYMNEERELADKHKYESPVWDTIEDTHSCYNKNVEHIISNMKLDDMLFVASHNVDTVALATKLTD
jgi:proline dehydrogenase